MCSRAADLQEALQAGSGVDRGDDMRLYMGRVHREHGEEAGRPAHRSRKAHVSGSNLMGRVRGFAELADVGVEAGP